MILTVTANAAIDKRYVVDSYGVGEVNRVHTCTFHAGGKGINVARVAYLAGEKVKATGFLGGHSGQFIAEDLEKQGVETAFVWCEGESRTCINIWDESAHTQTEFLEPGFAVDAEDCERLSAQIDRLLDETDVLTISGSTPAGAGADLYKDLIRRAVQKGKPVLLDTSGKLLQECVEAKPTMIKPNIDEIRQLTGREITSREEMCHAAAQLHEKGIEIVVISLGGDGSLVSCREGVFDVRVPRLDTVNTVGCGDSMIAGFAAGMARGLSLEETMRLASAVSAANALQQETGFIDPKDVETLLPQIQITKTQ